MSELARNIASRLRHFIGDRRRAERFLVNLPVTVSLLNLKGIPHGQRIEGHTIDISTTGLAVVVPIIRLGDHYLAGDNLSLHVRLELPVGQLEFHASPVRYERLEEDDSERGYLIGLHVTAMNEVDRGRYDEYLASLLKK
jgi:hypothetical protein